MKKYIFKKKILLFHIKIFILFITSYHFILICDHYFRYKYRYNLIVEDNNEGFEWKPMSVCTESKVLFDKHKVVQYGDLFEKYSEYKIRVLDQYYKSISMNQQEINEFQFEIESKIGVKIEKYLRSGLKYYIQPEIKKIVSIEHLFVAILDKISHESNYLEMSSMVVSENELFECSAKLHYNNQSIDSNPMIIKNCFEYFQIKTTVIDNSTFGICYEFFETNSSFILYDNDYIELIIKFEKQKDFIINYFKLNNIIIKHNAHEIWQYFRWYYFINDDKSIASKSSLISSTRIGLSAELKVSKTSIEMLSIPYMTYCEHFGCRHDFYKLSLDNDIFTYNNDTFISITKSKKKHLIYHAEPSLEFIDFISNIGGIFALYFGLSFIDISDILILFTRRITFQLQQLKIYRNLKKFIHNLKSKLEILYYIKLIPWKMILIVVSSLFFISQMFELISIYFQYSTQISSDFIEYQQKNQKISINEFPAITVCTEHMFEKAFFDQFYIDYNKIVLLHFYSFYENNRISSSTDSEPCELHWDAYIQKNNLNTSNINILSFIVNHCKKSFENEDINLFFSNHFDINTEEEYHQVIRRIDDKHINGLNGTLDLLDFFVNHHKCWTLYEPNIKCNDLKPMTKMLSPFGKCHTYLMGNYSNELFVEKIAISTGDHQSELRQYLKRKFILHSSNNLPIWTSNHFRATDVSFDQKNSFVVRISKTEFVKLPPPYDIKCHDYSEKQQFDCLNECIEKYYNEKLKCFPNNNNYFTILVDDQIFKKDFFFCNNTENISKKIELFARSCNSQCRVLPCSKTYLNEEIIPSRMEPIIKNWGEKSIEFIFDNVDYLKIIWLPQLTIISLFIKTFNIWSLWHGIYFKLFIDLIFEYVRQVYSFIFRTININNNWKII